MAALSLSPSRALHRPRRLDTRVLVGLFLTLATLGGSIAAWSTATAGRTVLEVTHSLPAGTLLTPADLTSASVRVDDGIYAGLVPGADRTGVVGQTLAEAVSAHSLLTRVVLASQPPLGADEMELTIPATAQTALDGDIHPGDTVAILWTQGKGTPQSQTTVLIDRARVRSVGYDTATAALNPGTTNTRAGTGAAVNAVTLLLTRAQAIAVAQAKWNGELDLARVPAQGSVSPPSAAGSDQTKAAQP